MPLQEVALPYIPSRISIYELKDNRKLLTEAEIAAVIEGLKDKPDGRYRKEIFNRLQMKNHHYGIIKHADNYYAVFKGRDAWTIYNFHHTKVKIAQDLKTGEWLRLKVYTNKPLAQIQNEFNYLSSMGLAVHQFSRQSRATDKKTSVLKNFILSKIKPGVDLTEFIQLDKHIPLINCLRLAIDILEKIQSVHAQGYLLCKATPNDFIVDATNTTVTICDYGSITAMDANQQAQRAFSGDKLYIAPEILNEWYLIKLLLATQSHSAITDPLTTKRLAAIVESLPALNSLKTSAKTALIAQFRGLKLEEIKYLLKKVHNKNVAPTYTHTIATDSYAAGVILKVLFNLPVNQIYETAELKKKFFKIGKDKSLYHQQALLKCIDDMTADNPENRVTITQALTLLKGIFQQSLPAARLKVGIIDIVDFNLFGDYKKVPDEFWLTTLKKLMQHMDEIYVIAKTDDYSDTVRIQKSLGGLGSIYHKNIIVTPTLNALTQLPAHINAINNDGVPRSFIYLDFSKFSNSQNNFSYIEETGLNGLRPNGHSHTQPARDGFNIILTPVEGNARRVLSNKEMKEFLLAHEINVITIDLAKPLAIYEQQLTQCLITLSAEQFTALTSYLQREIEKCTDKAVNSVLIASQRAHMESSLRYLIKMQRQNTLTYTIAQSTLSSLQQQIPVSPATNGQFFERKSKFGGLLKQLTVPDKATIKLAP